MTFLTQICLCRFLRTLFNFSSIRKDECETHKTILIETHFVYIELNFESEKLTTQLSYFHSFDPLARTHTNQREKNNL